MNDKARWAVCDMRSHRRKITAFLCAVLAAITVTVLSPGRIAEAASNTSAQTVSATVVAGVLVVTAPPALVTNLTPGSNNSGIALAAVTYTNTLNDATPWSVTLTSNDWSSGSNLILFNGMTVTAGTAFTSVAGSTGTPAAGAGGTLAGADGTPGTTQSTPVTLASGAASTQGTYTQTGSTISVIVPGGTPTGVYTGTIQYTITG